MLSKEQKQFCEYLKKKMSRRKIMHFVIPLLSCMITARHSNGTFTLCSKSMKIFVHEDIAQVSHNGPSQHQKNKKPWQLINYGVSKARKSAQIGSWLDHSNHCLCAN